MKTRFMDWDRIRFEMFYWAVVVILFVCAVLSLMGLAWITWQVFEYFKAIPH